MADEPDIALSYTYNAEVVKVVDGDTLDLLVDLGFRVFTKVRCRLCGVDTPEKYGVKKSSEEYQRGVAASDFVEGWLSTLGDRVTIRSFDAKPLGQGKYGRWLCTVWSPSGGACLNEDLIEAGHASRVTYG